MDDKNFENAALIKKQINQLEEDLRFFERTKHITISFEKIWIREGGGSEPRIENEKVSEEYCEFIKLNVTESIRKKIQKLNEDFKKL